VECLYFCRDLASWMFKKIVVPYFVVLSFGSFDTFKSNVVLKNQLKL
jgi:hypothetical protein